MGLERTHLKRFTKALTTWFQANATLVTLTSHTSGDPRIYVFRGDDPLKRPALILDVIETNQYLFDVDGVYSTEVQAICYAESRIAALDIAGQVLVMCRQDATTLADAGFESDNIRTKGLRALGVTAQGESLLEATSIRRTERSDVVAPDRYAAIIPILVTWIDTTA